MLLLCNIYYRKLTVIPTVFIIFITYFSELYPESVEIIVITLVVVYCTSVLIREYPGLKKEFQTTMDIIHESAHSVAEFQKLFYLEKLLFNYYFYRKFTAQNLVIDWSTTDESSIGNNKTNGSSGKEQELSSVQLNVLHT